MSFSIAQVWADPVALPAITAFIIGYVVAAVFAARRAGAPGLWKAWAGATLLGAIAMGGGLWPPDPLGLLLALAAMAGPTGVCALVIARTLCRPGVRKRVQLLLGGVAFVLAIPLGLVVMIAAVVAWH